MVELQEMTKEELIAVIDIKNFKIKELEQEIELLKEIIKTKAFPD